MRSCKIKNIVLIQEGEMPRCEGRPEGACPARVIDNSVKSCQGDLWLCKDCEEYRFPTPSTSCLATNSVITNSSATLHVISDKQHVSDGEDAVLQHNERNSDKHDKKFVVNELLYFINNHTDTTPSASLKSVIVEFYREEEVIEAKQRLLSCFSDLKTYGLTGFAKNRTGVNKVKTSVDDIFGIFRTVDERSLLDRLLLFCAVNAKRVPTLPEDRSDLASIRYDWACLKDQFDKFIKTQPYACPAVVQQQMSVEPTLSTDIGASSSLLQQTNGSEGSSSVQSSALLSLQTLPEDEDALKQDTSKVTYSSVVEKNPTKRSDKVAAASTKPGTSCTSSSVEQVQSDGEYQLVSHRRNRPSKGKFVIGGNKSCEFFQGVVRKSVFCISRLQVDVKPQMVTDFLTSNGITVLSCYEAKRNDNFNTLRVCVPTPDTKKLCSEELWPYGVVVRPWVFRSTGSH